MTIRRTLEIQQTPASRARRQEIDAHTLLLPATVAVSPDEFELKTTEGSPRRGWWLLGLLALAGAGTAALLLRRQPKAVGIPGELKTAANLHLARLAGDWYEIARMPGHLPANAMGLQVTFEILDATHLALSYRWHEGSFDAPEQSEAKQLYLPDAAQPAKLKKSLLNSLEFDYWVLEAGGHYDYLVIGTPSRQHLWILSRHADMSEGAFQAIVQRMAEQGFDTTRLQRVVQHVAQRVG